MKVGIYARVSTKDKGQEVENQSRQLRDFAALQGWTIYREYIDHETAKTDDRAEFQAMFRDASTRKFDVLLFWALDRLSSEGVLETLQHLNRLTSYPENFEKQQEVLSRAQSLLGRPFRLLNANCEDYVNWIVTGVARSPQRQRAGLVAALVIVLVIGDFGGALVKR